MNSEVETSTSDSADAGQVSMMVPVAAGLMSALRRLLARRVALKVTFSLNGCGSLKRGLCS